MIRLGMLAVRQSSPARSVRRVIADYFTANPDADKNGDGIQYVMLQGEPGHQDATLRSEHAPKAIEEAGFQVEQLVADTAMWDKVKATDLMAAFISSQGLDKIEAVLCNNDDMALGAIEAGAERLQLRRCFQVYPGCRR